MKPRESLWALTGLAVAAQLAGCFQRPSESESLSAAKSHISKKDFKSAGVELKSLLQVNGSSAEARYLFGKSLFEIGQPGFAEVELRKSLELNYPAGEVIPLLASAMLQTAQYKRIVDDYSATALNPAESAAALRTTLAKALNAMGRKAEAEAALAAAVRGVPNFPAALVFGAQMRADTGDIDGAIQRLDTVLSDDPKNAEAWRAKGDAQYFGKGDSEGALINYRKALDANPRDQPALIAIIAVRLSRGEIEEAEKQLKQLRLLYPGHIQVAVFDAELAFSRKQYTKARELLLAIIRSEPGNLRVLQLAGATELAANSPVQAEAYLGKAVRLHPQVASVRILLARAYLQSGQYQNALGTLAPVIDRADVPAYALSTAGEAYLGLGDASRALGMYEQAAKARPDDAKLKIGRAQAILATGQVEMALSEFARIAEIDKEINADIALIAERIKRRDWAKANSAIDSLERKRPNNAFTDQMRGDIQVRQGDNAAARKSFERALSIDGNYFPALQGLIALDLIDYRTAAAHDRLKIFLDSHKNHVSAILAMAKLEALAGAGRDNVVKRMTDAKLAEPSDLSSRVALAEYYLKLGAAKQALVELREADGIAPNQPDILDLMGRALLGSGDDQQALLTFGKWSALQPKSPLPHIRMAELEASRKRWDAALEQYKRAQALSPELAPVQRAIVKTLAAAGRIDRAVSFAREVQVKRPADAIGYSLEGDLEALRGRWEHAVPRFRSAVSKPDATAEDAGRFYLALVASNQPDAAEASADSWIKAHPRDGDFIFTQGQRALARKDLTAAERRFLNVLEVFPRNVSAINNVAWIMVQQKRSGAVEMAERAVALAPDSPEVLDTLASALAQAGQTDRAITIQKAAISKSPFVLPAYRVALAKLYVQSGNQRSALVELEAVAALGERFGGYAEVATLIQTLTK